MGSCATTAASSSATSGWRAARVGSTQPRLRCTPGVAGTSAYIVLEGYADALPDADTIAVRLATLPGAPAWFADLSIELVR